MQSVFRNGKRELRHEKTYVLRVCLEIFMNYSEKPSCKVKIDDIIYIFSKENMTGILRSFLRKIWKIMPENERKKRIQSARMLYHGRDTYVKLQKI